MKQDLKDYFSKIGRRGGKKVTAAKIEACRANAERFSIDRMIKRYDELCIEALDTGGW